MDDRSGGGVGDLMVARWLREVANAWVHATTGAVPTERLAADRTRLLAVPPAYGGRSLRASPANPRTRPIVGPQHPLALYDAFAGVSS